MDEEMIDSYQRKLSHFLLKELKDVLAQVGLPKQGKKQDLMDRIMALLYDEGTPGVFKNNVNGKEKLVEAIDDIHRVMHESEVNGSSSKKKNSSSGTSRKRKEEAEELSELERKIQCPCGSDVPSGSPLVQCVDPDCSVWQHVSCVIIPGNPMEKISVPTEFLCEICRLKRADPFWATIAHPLYPVKFGSTILSADGANPQLTVEKTFRLTKVDRELVQKTDCDIQAWCMLLNDVVPFRMQWPLHSALEANGIPVKTASRAALQHLGANGRDDGAKVTLYIAEGVNKISLSCTDARIFCFGVRIVRRRTCKQVLSMIPKESDGETFEDALSRVQRCIGGGITTGNDDSDSDLEVIADSISVNLRCPMSGSRMKTAGRFKACGHMGCFDLETFVGLNQFSRKWQCPICLKNYSLEDVIVDPFFNLILNKMQSCGEEIYEIDMKPDGSWRVKNARDVGDLAQWHHPDGSIQVPSQQQTTQEHVPEGCTSQLGMQSNVVDHHADGRLYDQVENFEQNIITMSSTTTGDVKDDGDPSINQDDVQQFGVADMNEPEISSVPPDFGQTYESGNQNPNLYSICSGVIILSDSEDDDVNAVYPTPIPVPYNHERCSVPAAASVENPGDFSRNADDFLVSPSPTPLNLPGGSGFKFFGTSDTLLDEHNSSPYSGSVNCMLTTGSTIEPVHHVITSYDPHDSSFNHRFASANGNASSEVLIPSPLISGNELPILNNPGEDWITLKTGVYANESSSGNMAAHHESSYGNGTDLQPEFRSNEGLLQRDHGESGHTSGSGSGCDLVANRKRSDCPFTFPRQQRSVRRRSTIQSSKDITSKQS